MKNKVILNIALFISAITFAQVGIGTTDPNANAILDLTATNKALLHPRVANTAAVPNPVNGMMIYDISSNCIKGYENGAWSNCLSASGTSNELKVTANCVGFVGTFTEGVALSGASYRITLTNNTFSTANISYVAADLVLSGASAGITIGTPTPATPQNLAPGASVTLNYPLTGTPTQSGTLSATWTKRYLTCNSTREITAATFPSTLTLNSISNQFISSIFDQDYLPYNMPTTAATLATAVVADGTNEPNTIDVQGKLTTTGLALKIPYTVTGATVFLPSYSQTVNIPAAFTQDGIARDVQFSYSGSSLAVGSGTINATLKAVGGDLNAKKLDLQTGLGNDFLGWLLGQFTYPRTTSTTNTFDLRIITGIPDLKFGTTSTQGPSGSGVDGQYHNFLYLPKVAEDGNVWLNNNLGANYNNVNSPDFNPAQQATASNDYKAYGSLYQWGRLSDGHELVTWTNGSTGVAKNGYTSTSSTTDNPGNRYFIQNNQPDWRSVGNNNLWQGSVGINNPCPQGYRLPTLTEQNNLVSAASITNGTTAFASQLKLTLTGYNNNGPGTPIDSEGTLAFYWTSTIFSATTAYVRVLNTGTNADGLNRSYGCPVRCIKETATPATFSLNCAAATPTGNAYAGTAVTAATISIPYTGGNSGWIAATTAVESTGVTGLSATYAGSNNIGTSGNMVFTITGTPSAAGTASFNLNVGGQNCTATYTVSAAPLPATLKLFPVSNQYIASIYDQDYLPYTMPTTAATLATAIPADGTNETNTLNIQGKLTTSGLTIKIPYTVTTSTANLVGFSQTVNVPASYTQDGIARDVQFSYSGSSLAVGSGTINATLKAVGGDLNVKQLDLQTGLGNDYLGWLLAQFSYATNNTVNPATFDLRIITGIPDRKFGTTTTQGGNSGQYHNFLYVPTLAEDGNIWLNNNLGANYSNANSSDFNPVQQATSVTDYKAYGSFYQWGRLTDGHELINWTSSTTGTAINSVTTPTLANSDTPPNNLFITIASGNYDWRGATQNNNLWQGEAGINNPCPSGFRLPTNVELTTLTSNASITSPATAASSSMKFTVPGLRSFDGSLYAVGTDGAYWSSTVNGSNSSTRNFYNTGTNTTSSYRVYGFTVRCIKETAAPATFSLNCAGATTTGNAYAGTAVTAATISIPYTGGNSGWVTASTPVASTGVTGLSATYAGSNNIGTSGDMVFTITGTPSGAGTATFNLNVGGQSCVATYTVTAFIPTNPVGAGSFSGKTCFDIALGNDNTNSCGPLSARTATQSNFTNAATHTQSYTFTPSGTVSNVRFVYVNTNGSAVTAISGNNTGNNISTAVVATVNYVTTNAPFAGLTNSNPATTDIYVIYNDGATNNGTDRQLKLTPKIKDCDCCIVKISPTEYKEFMCHNLGADTSLDPNVPVQGIHGNYYQWGRSTVVANATTPATAISGFNYSPAPDGSWADNTKTANDPCPTGYRIPTSTQWNGVIENNTAIRTGSWLDDSNFTTAIHWGPNSSTKALTLPTMGYRAYIDSNLYDRGKSGIYWASTTTYSASFTIQFVINYTNIQGYNRVNAFPIRCIAE